MGGSGGTEAYRAMARQEKARQKKLEERRQRQTDRLNARTWHDASGARIEVEPEPAGEALACPSCHARFDFGDYCPECRDDLIGVSFLTGAPKVQHTQEVITGPRYTCESCGARGADASTCGSCGHWELLDLHNPTDRRYAETLTEHRNERRYTRRMGAGVLAAVLGLVLLLVGMVYIAAPLIAAGGILTIIGVALAGDLSRL